MAIDLTIYHFREFTIWVNNFVILDFNKLLITQVKQLLIKRIMIQILFITLLTKLIFRKKNRKRDKSIS